MASNTPVSSSPANITAAQRLARYNATTGYGSHSQALADTKEEATMRKLFSIRSAHLPGNNWCQDWMQYMKNNHPLLGLCCRHRLNPIGIGPRLVLLLASVSFGLVAINLVYLFYDYYDANGVLLEIKLDGSDQGGFTITYYMIALWTIGGVLHSLADLGMWHLTACACCLPGSGCHKRCGFLGKVGPYAAVAITAFLSAGATFAILLRASYEASNGNVDVINDDTWLNIGDVESFSFLMAYLSELGMVYLCWHPLLSTLYFAGAIWRIFPCIGGRPKEIQRQKDEAKRVAHERGEHFEDDDIV